MTGRQVMVGKDILNGVYEFIKINPNRNQSDIVRGLKEVCTRLPVLDALDELTSDKDGAEEPKVNFSRNTPKGSYRYYVNDRNEYNNLMALIENLEGLAHKQEIILSENYVKLQKIKNPSHIKNLHNLLFMYTIFYYNQITGITVAIDARIKNVIDRESLHMRLTKSILIGHRMNVAILPLVNHAIVESLAIERQQDNENGKQFDC